MSEKKKKEREASTELWKDYVNSYFFFLNREKKNTLAPTWVEARRFCVMCAPVFFLFVISFTTVFSCLPLPLFPPPTLVSLLWLHELLSEKWIDRYIKSSRVQTWHAVSTHKHQITALVRESQSAARKNIYIYIYMRENVDEKRGRSLKVR